MLCVSVQLDLSDARTVYYVMELITCVGWKTADGTMLVGFV